MSLRVETTPDDPHRGAILYGPIVLAARAGTEGMIDPAPHSDPSLYNDYYTYDYHIPTSICDSLTIAPGELLPSLQRSSSALSFTLPDGRILEPLYDIHRERYIVYWHFPNPANR